MAIHSRPIPLPLPLPLPTASRPAATPLAMHSLSHLRLATAYARYVTTSCNRLSKFPVRSAAKVRVSSSNTVDKDRWLDAFSYPLTRKAEVGLDSHSHSDSDLGEVIVGSGSESEWIIGVDPDVHGALALLRPDQSPCGYSAEVFDAPYVNVMVGKRLRKRLDPRSIVQLLHSFNAPIGTKAYIEQSSPFPQDGKQDDSRKSASDMFPSLASMLKRKKDHGRAEALLIAAYGRSLTLQSNLNSTLIESKELELLSC